MPTLINNYYEYALLAQAAYADDGSNTGSLKTDADFSDVQVNQFHWLVSCLHSNWPVFCRRYEYL